MSTSQPERRTLTRAELYEKVWTTPVRTLAAEFGISDRGLAKICERLDVPRPGVGYWARIQHRQEPKRVALPARKNGVPETVEIRRSVEGPVEDGQPPPPRPEPPVVVVGTTLASPHPTVRAIQTALGETTADADGILVLRGNHQTPIRLTTASRQRALLLLDALFKGLAARGHAVVLDAKSVDRFTTYSLQTVVAGQKLGLSLMERTSQTVRSEEELAKLRRRHLFASEHAFTATGRPVLVAGRHYHTGGRSWSDGRRQRLESVLGEIVLGIEELAAFEAEEERQREAQRRAEAAEARQRQIAAQRAEHERALTKDLTDMANAWADAKNLRAFLTAVEEGVPAEFKTEGFRAWVDWARARVEAVDPLSDPRQIAKVLEPRTPDPVAFGC
jgi:hypothetical protein